MAHPAVDADNLAEVAAYWRSCLNDLGDRDDQKVAYDMVRVVSNEHYEEWYAEGEGDPVFVEVFDLVADLETPIERELPRDQAWERVKELVGQMP